MCVGNYTYIATNPRLVVDEPILPRQWGCKNPGPLAGLYPGHPILEPYSTLKRDPILEPYSTLKGLEAYSALKGHLVLEAFSTLKGDPILEPLVPLKEKKARALRISFSARTGASSWPPSGSVAQRSAMLPRTSRGIMGLGLGFRV